jgi:hypothetical protein
MPNQQKNKLSPDHIQQDIGPGYMAQDQYGNPKKIQPSEVSNRAIGIINSGTNRNKSKKA